MYLQQLLRIYVKQQQQQCFVYLNKCDVADKIKISVLGSISFFLIAPEINKTYFTDNISN